MLECHGNQWDLKTCLILGMCYIFSGVVDYGGEATLITERGSSERLETDYISQYFTLESLLQFLRKQDHYNEKSSLGDP